jgi:hypothetical protein
VFDGDDESCIKISILQPFPSFFSHSFGGLLTTSGRNGYKRKQEVKVPILHFELGASTSHFRVDGQHDGLHEESMTRVKSK